MAPKESSAEQTGTTMEYTRLHITPFNASLLSAIVPPSMSNLAKNISFHNIETFPEKQYGFVELPKEQATKIKQKLNGAVLRGSKIVIQEARAAPRIVSPDPEMAKREEKRKERKAKGGIPVPEEKLEDSAPKEKSKKRKRHDEPLKGQEVKDRQIKRGWTDPNAESKAVKKEKRSREKEADRKERKDEKAEREKSKYTTGPEALIRTTLPPNVILPSKGIEGVIVDKKAKKSKKGKDVIIHEFAKTEKFATFLRQKPLPGAAKPAVEFRGGEGWFDEDGNKVEGEPPKSKHNDDVLEKIKKENKLKKPRKKATPEPEPKSEEESEEDVAMTEAPKMVYNSDSETSSSGSSASESDEEDSADEIEEKETVDKKDDIEDIFAAVGSSSDSESQAASPAAAESPDKAMAAASSSAKSSSPSPISTTAPAPEKVEEPVYIHTTTASASTRPVTPITALSSTLKISIPENPLEAIFKPKKATTDSDKTDKTETPFSFGNLGADIDSDYEEDEEFVVEQAPMTPFTEQDVAWRNVRSAAPTPDTAHPSRKQLNGWPVDEDEDVNGFKSRSPTEQVAGGKGKAGETEEAPKGTDPNADFQKWFYEHRGDTNRAWKKRRKEVKKEVRQRENRKGGNNQLK